MMVASMVGMTVESKAGPKGAWTAQLLVGSTVGQKDDAMGASTAELMADETVDEMAER